MTVAQLDTIILYSARKKGRMNTTEWWLVNNNNENSSRVRRLFSNDNIVPQMSSLPPPSPCYGPSIGCNHAGLKPQPQSPLQGRLEFGHPSGIWCTSCLGNGHLHLPVLAMLAASPQWSGATEVHLNRRGGLEASQCYVIGCLSAQYIQEDFNDDETTVVQGCLNRWDVFTGQKHKNSHSELKLYPMEWLAVGGPALF